MPAALVTIWYRREGTAKLLILSQVVLSLQLPFAMVPLVHVHAPTGRKMGELVAPALADGVASLVAALIIGLNVKLVWDFATGG